MVNTKVYIMTILKYTEGNTNVYFLIALDTKVYKQYKYQSGEPKHYMSNIKLMFLINEGTPYFSQTDTDPHRPTQTSQI